jgi:plastocyanin
MFLILLSLVILASAQPIQRVLVGSEGLTFRPEDFTAAPGSDIEFFFLYGTHSVSASSYDNPCHPVSDTTFFSGVVPAVSDPLRPSERLRQSNTHVV